MNRSLLTSTLAAAALALPAMLAAETLDFSKITHWTGEGANQAALIVRFNDAQSGDDAAGAIVWGYRWPEGESRTSDVMISEIARDSKDLVILIQYTGGMGYTLDGIGYAPDVNRMLDGLYFDYDAAAEDGNISFGYVYPNTGMGQTSAPGAGTVRDLCQQAIDLALESHVIDHPLNQKTFGYPAYDYDHWKLDRERMAASVASTARWQSGWYWGYWSFWVGAHDFDRNVPQDIDDLSYSGMGMSSTPIYNGQISAWKYMFLGGKPLGSGDDDADAADAVTGASTRWGKLAYDHVYPEVTTAAVNAVEADTESLPADIYTLGGVKVGTVAASAPVTSLSLEPGVYVVRRGSRASKLLIK